LKDAGVKVIYYFGKNNDLTFFKENSFHVEKFVGRKLPLSQIKTHCELFDGVQIDIEPVKSGSESYLDYLRQVRKACPRPKTVSVAASVFHPPKDLFNKLLKPSKVYVWDKSYFNQVAEHVDTIMAMNYDIGA